MGLLDGFLSVTFPILYLYIFVFDKEQVKVVAWSLFLSFKKSEVIQSVGKRFKDSEQEMQIH